MCLITSSWKMMEEGILTKILEPIYGALKSGEGNEHSVLEAEGIRIQALAMPFAGLVLSIIVAPVVAILEYVVHIQSKNTVYDQ